MKKQRVVVLMKNQGGKMQLTLVLNYSCQSKTQTFEKNKYEKQNEKYFKKVWSTILESYWKMQMSRQRI